MLELLVNIGELMAAAAKMNEALNRYNEAIGNVKAAAEDLGSKWEGDGQVAFLADQAQAYTWYSSLVQVVMAMIDEARKMAERYEDNINTLKSIMQG